MSKEKDVLQGIIDFIDEIATHALGPELKSLYKVKLYLQSLQPKYTMEVRNILANELQSLIDDTPQEDPLHMFDVINDRIKQYIS